jgi:hypothetical protein
LIKIQNLGLAGAAASTPVGTSPPSVDGLTSGTDAVANGCVGFRPAVYTPQGATGSLELTIPASGVLIRDGTGTATVAVRRFGSQFLTLGTVAAGADATLVIRPDLAPAPWHAQISAGSSLSVCRLG